MLYLKNNSKSFDNQMQIASIKAYQVLDSRGEPTVRVRMESDTGNHARFDSPGGSSVADQEAKERRDGGEIFGGRGVTGNVDVINNIIAPKFIGYPLAHQADFDALLTALDGTSDRSNLGTNTMTAVSGAYFLLSCYEQDKEVWQLTADLLGSKPAMPRLYANIIAGGSHAPGLDLQEIIAVPQTSSPAEALQLIYTLYRTLRSIFQNLYGPSVQLVSEEGAMAPLGAGAEVVLEALQQFALKAESKFDIALDMAANHFFTGTGYQLAGQLLSMEQLGQLYMQWDQRFPILSIEDPFAEQDIEGLKYLSIQPGRKFFVAGDDFTASQAQRITDLATQRLIGAVVVKPNQVGTISDMFEGIRVAQTAGLQVIISDRSGDTNDTFLSDVAFGAGAFGFKLGAPIRGERVAKYNRLIEIEQDTRPILATTGEPPAALTGSMPGLATSPVPGLISPAPAPPISIPGALSVPPAVSFNTPSPSSVIHRGPVMSEKAAQVLHRYEDATTQMASDLEPVQAVPHGSHAQAFSPVEGAYHPPTANSANQPPPFRY